MAYEAKTNWKLDDTVMPEDMNRIEQGIKNVELSLEDAGGITILEASTDNVIDFNTLTEPGVYLIKNVANGTSSNLPMISDSPYDVILFVQDNTNHTQINQRCFYSNIQVPAMRKYTSSWTAWDYKLIASYITAGTLAGQVVANATSVATLGNAQVRNIQASTTDLTAGTSSLTTGDIYLVFE